MLPWILEKTEEVSYPLGETDQYGDQSKDILNSILKEEQLYSTANDPETTNDPQNGPQMILDRKWSPKSTANDPERKIGMTCTQVSGFLLVRHVTVS